MSCFGIEGVSLGSASRRLRLDAPGLQLGALVLASFGRAGDLRLPTGMPGPQGQATPEAGSCIVVRAPTAPRSAPFGSCGGWRCGRGSGWLCGERQRGCCSRRHDRQSGAARCGRRSAEQRVLAEGKDRPIVPGRSGPTQEAVMDALCRGGDDGGTAWPPPVGLRETLGRVGLEAQARTWGCRSLGGRGVPERGPHVTGSTGGRRFLWHCREFILIGVSRSRSRATDDPACRERYIWSCRSPAPTARSAGPPPAFRARRAARHLDINVRRDARGGDAPISEPATDRLFHLPPTMAPGCAPPTVHRQAARRKPSAAPRCARNTGDAS